MLRFAFEVNNFFPSCEIFCFAVGASRFLQSRGAVMLLSASGVNRFFRFRESLFRLRLPDQFSLVAKVEIAPKSPAWEY